MTNGWEPDERTIKEVLADLREGFLGSMSGPLEPTPPIIVSPKVAAILKKAGYTIKDFKREG